MSNIVSTYALLPTWGHVRRQPTFTLRYYILVNVVLHTPCSETLSPLQGYNMHPLAPLYMLLYFCGPYSLYTRMPRALRTSNASIPVLLRGLH